VPLCLLTRNHYLPQLKHTGDGGVVIAYYDRMEVTESIQCPFCGQSFDLVIDTSIVTQRFTTDCEVCCRPFEVFVECEPGEVVSLEIRG
jgi:hypothetical protein